MRQGKKKYVRRHFYVKKRFQSRFMMVFVLLVLIGGFLSTGMVIFFAHGNTTALFNNSELKIFDTSFYLLPAVISANLVTVIIIALAVAAMALFVSHKIAGPLFRFENDIRVIATGDLTHKICLRKKDQLKALSTDINDMTVRLGEEIDMIKSDLQRVMTSSKDQAAPQWFQEDLKRLYRRVNENFKTGNSNEKNRALHEGK